MPGAGPGPFPAGERLYRRIAGDSYVFDHELQLYRPSTQAFIQGGRDGDTSAYIVSETTPGAVAALGSEPYMVEIPLYLVTQVCLRVVRDEGGGGFGHVNIVGRKTRSRLKRLVMEAHWVDGYSPGS